MIEGAEALWWVDTAGEVCRNGVVCRHLVGSACGTNIVGHQCSRKGALTLLVARSPTLCEKWERDEIVSENRQTTETDSSIAHCLIYPVDPGLCVQRPFVITEALLYRYIRSVLSTEDFGGDFAGSLDICWWWYTVLGDVVESGAGTFQLTQGDIPLPKISCITVRVIG